MSVKRSWSRVTDQEAYAANWDKIYNKPKVEEQPEEPKQTEEVETTDEV